MSFASQIRREADERKRQEKRTDFLSMIGALVVLTISFAAWLSVVRGLQRWRANLGQAVSEREQAQQALRRVNDELEACVTARTGELGKTNQALQAEITGRKRIEEALQRQKTELRVLFDWMPAIVWFKDTENRILRANKRAAEIVGKPVEEIEGKPSLEIFPQEAAKYYSDDLEVIHSGAPKLGIVETLRDREGKEQWGQTDKVPVCDQDGKVTGIIVMTQDITGRKRLEAQLLQSQKMETVGKLTGGIAHEFNSILTTIIGHSEFLLNDLPAESPLANNATEISKAAGRAAMLTRQLLAYGRKQFLQPETLDLNQVITDMEGVFQHLMGKDVDTRIVPAPGLQAVRADAGQIEQVIMNLAINARDAMPGGGKLTLETANVSFDQDSVGRSPEMKPGDYVMLAITDTGKGMSAEVKAHVFEPFFSTKGVGQGAGLGLSTCYGIVKQSGGYISVYSEFGRGTAFKIYLPQVEPAPKIPLQRLDSPDLQRGTETILLVEDDPALREMAATMLRRLGYTVLAAADGIEALNLKQQRDNGHIDLLFTDVVMPHMSGKELADRVRALYPHIRILFTSAYTENAIIHQGVLNHDVKLLQKPFTPSALARKLREVLDEPPLPALEKETEVQNGKAKEEVMK
jgi:PAS domain S-box-containing protein